MTHTKEFLSKVAEVHRRAGFLIRVQTRAGKTYFTIDSKNVKSRPPALWSERANVSNHIKSIFPQAYSTSGLWSADGFKITFRIDS